MEFNGIWNFLQTQGLRLIGALIVLVVGFVIAHWLVKLLLQKARLKKIDPMLQTFLQKLMQFLLYAVVVLTAVGVMGVPMTTVVTLMASAGVAVSLAMQGALGNLVGGVTILLLKPFKAGDYVKVGDTEGTIRGVGVFYTELVTPDNRHISMPNSSLTNAAIVNFTREGTRRMDVNFSVSYDADMNEVCRVLTDMVRQTPDILSDPAPLVTLAACENSSLNFVVRVWCESGKYWDVYYALIRGGKAALDAAKIEIPYPQMDVHIR